MLTINSLTLHVGAQCLGGDLFSERLAHAQGVMLSAAKNPGLSPYNAAAFLNSAEMLPNIAAVLPLLAEVFRLWPTLHRTLSGRGFIQADKVRKIFIQSLKTLASRQPTRLTLASYLGVVKYL